MKNHFLIAAAAALFAAGGAPAQKVHDAEALKPQADLYRKIWAEEPNQRVAMTTPLYGRILRIYVPPGFVPAYKVEHNGQFLFELTHGKETVKDWSRLITIRSIRGLGQSTFDDAALAETMFSVGGCPQHGFLRVIDRKKLGDDLSTVTVSIGCGNLDANAYLEAKAGAGEQNFIRFFRDRENVYSVAFAIRGAPFAAASPPLSDAEGQKLLAQFGDILLCTADDPSEDCQVIRLLDSARKGTR